MNCLRLFRPLSCLALVSSVLLGDGLQKRVEGDFQRAVDPARQEAVLVRAIQEGLALPPGKDLSTYLTECFHAQLRLPSAWDRYTSGIEPGGGNLLARRAQFLRDLELPLSAAHLSLARHYLQSRKIGAGYALDLSETFQQDLDLAIATKNAAALQRFFLHHLAEADLGAEAKDPAATYQRLLAGIAQGPSGYTVQDYKDIFLFQAPDASADYIDEEIFSLYRTLKEQQAAVGPILRLLNEVAGDGTASLPERHRRLQRILGGLTFGSGPALVDSGSPEPVALSAVSKATTGWALRQGLMRTMVFGEHLAYTYASSLQLSAPLEGLRTLQRRLRVK